MRTSSASTASAASMRTFWRRAGVDTVPELAHRNAANLHEKMKTVNEAKELVRRLPSEKQVESWIEQAKALPRALEY